MSDFLLENIVQALALQGAVNAPSEDGTDYVKFLSSVQAPQIPNLDTVTSEGMVGDGFSMVLKEIRNYYWQTRPFSINGKLNDHITPILLNLWQGGAVTPTILGGTAAKDISAVMNVQNSTPKLLSLYRHLGGERFINSTLAPNNFTIEQQGEGQPTFGMDLLSTGHHLDADEIDDTDFDEANITEAPDYQEFHGAATEVTATDGVETYNWTADGELTALRIEGSRNVDVRRRPGDTFKVVGDHKSGAYARKIRNGKFSGAVRLTVDLDDQLRTFKAMVAGRKLTGLSITFNGFDKIGATIYDYEFAVTVPRAGFQMIEGETDQDFGALALNIQPLRDTVTKGAYTNRTRTDKTIILV